MKRKPHTKLLPLSLALVLGASCVPWAAAVGDGVAPSCDEAYYATLDYYGNLQEGSVVKSYALHGAEAITDYGAYDEVVNLTDGTPADTRDYGTTFHFEDGAPDHFYFQGRTQAPFAQLPWSITLHYTLNGVPTRAEDLAGQQGVVELQVDILPNPSAADYARNNYTLEAMAVFNQDDILSLEAPGAQVQLVGNLRTVLFVALPGEERHYTIRVGSNDFSFGGMTFLMVPATLAQLEDVAEIGQRKEDIERDYQNISGSLDGLLDAMGNMQGGLNASAQGLDQLNQARQTFSNGKGTLYEGTDTLRGDLTAVAEALTPVEERVKQLSQTVTEANGVLNELTDTTVSLKQQLQDMETALKTLENGAGDVKDLLRSGADMQDSLERLEKALNDIPSVSLSTPPRPSLPSLPETIPPEIRQAVEAVLGQINGALDKLDRIQKQISDVLSAVKHASNAAGDVAGDLAKLCGQLDELVKLVDGATDLSAALRQASGKIQAILDDADALRQVLNAYEPVLQEGLRNLGSLSTTAAATVTDTETLLGNAEDLLKTTGVQLDAGTQQSLSGIAASLRQAAKAMGATSDVKRGKNALTGILEDSWQEYTGEKNNLLLMDANAQPVSLTDPRNPAPASVQVLIRTQEIQVEEPAEEQTETESKSSSFFGRIGQMFQDFGHAIASIFR